MDKTFLVFSDPIRILGAYLSEYFPGIPIKDGTPSNWDWTKEKGPLVRLTEVGGSGRKWAEYQDAVIVVDVAAKNRSAASDLAQRMHAVALQAHFYDSGIEAVEPIAKPIFDPEEQANTPAYVFRIRMTYKGNEITL